jgi:hypothetical protein
MTRARYSLTEMLLAVTLIAAYLGMFAIAFRNAPTGDIVGRIFGMLVGAGMWLLFGTIGRSYSLRRAGPVYLELPTMFPWRFHIAIASVVFVTSLFLSGFSKPSAAIGGGMTVAMGFLIQTLTNPVASLCNGGVVYLNLVIPWSAVTPCRDAQGRIQFLKLGKHVRGIKAIVPPELRDRTERLVDDMTAPRVSHEHADRVAGDVN